MPAGQQSSVYVALDLPRAELGSREAWAEAGKFLQIIYRIRVKRDGVVVRKVKRRRRKVQPGR